MPRFVAATYHADIKVAEFVTDDGRHLLRAGGTLPWRINNCGDLISPVNSRGEPNPKLTRGYLGFAGILNKSATKTHHLFIFPDYETGRRELEASLKRKYAEKCIPNLVEIYAPSHENKSADYAKKLLSSTGIAPDKKVNELDSDEFTKLADAIERLEGYHNNADSRKEVWIPVTTITASDGARPLADEEIILRVNGKETTLRSNEVGQFPPIPHAPEPTEVLQRNANNTLKNIGIIEGNQGKSFSWIKRLQRFAGMAGPDKPPADANGQKQPFSYHVQPGDTLSSIAKRFRISVERIKIDNRLRNDNLFAGETLEIYGPPLQREVPIKVAPRITSAARTINETSNPRISFINTPLQSTLETRSDEGSGKPLALLTPDQRRTPWMVYAIAEAKRFKGVEETEIEASGTNYHAAIKDGIKTIVGDKNAWCAAFVNWCLLQAGYPIDTKGGWAARAHGIYSHDEKDETGKPIQNPLFIQIQNPIYGCIAMVTNIKSNRGKHVGFIYGQESNGNLSILGGNQANRIMFASTPKNSNGGMLLYFIPTAYQQQSLTDMKTTLETVDSIEINKQFSISTISAKPSSDR